MTRWSCPRTSRRPTSCRRAPEVTEPGTAQDQKPPPEAPAVATLLPATSAPIAAAAPTAAPAPRRGARAREFLVALQEIAGRRAGTAATRERAGGRTRRHCRRACSAPRRGPAARRQARAPAAFALRRRCTTRARGRREGRDRDRDRDNRDRDRDRNRDAPRRHERTAERGAGDRSAGERSTGERGGSGRGPEPVRAEDMPRQDPTAPAAPQPTEGRAERKAVAVDGVAVVAVVAAAVEARVTQPWVPVRRRTPARLRVRKDRPRSARPPRQPSRHAQATAGRSRPRASKSRANRARPASPASRRSRGACITPSRRASRQHHTSRHRSHTSSRSPRPKAAARRNNRTWCGHRRRRNPRRRPRAGGVNAHRRAAPARLRRAGALAQVREQSARGGFDEVEHLLETVRSAVVRIRHVLGACVRGELEKQPQPLVCRSGRTALQHRQVLAIHGEDQVETLEIARARRYARAVTRGHSHAAQQPGACAGRGLRRRDSPLCPPNPLRG